MLKNNIKEEDKIKINNKKMVALICCRGGSKGIPGKNIKDFCGKPLLEWTIKHANQANVFDDIILSTDSEEIARIGKKCGVNVPGLRPEHLSTDSSDVFETHQYIFNKLNITDSTHSVCILTNNPFIDAKLIKTGYNISSSKNFEIISLDTIEVDGDYLYFRQLYDKKGLLKFHFPKEMKMSGINRQSYIPTYTTINNMRWGKPSFMVDYNKYKDEIMKNGILPIPLPKSRNFDLDDSDDWNIAQAVYEKLFL